MILLDPAEPLAVWAVGQYAHHVAALRPPHQGVDAVEKFVGTGEFPGRGRVRLHHHPFEQINKLLVHARRRAFDLQVAAAVVEELREPLLRATTL